MFENVNWEALGVITAVLAATSVFLGWATKTFWGWRVAMVTAKQEKLIDARLELKFKAFQDKLDNQHEEIKCIQTDIKNAAAANVHMSNAFNSQINKILLTFAGRDHE